MEVLSVAAVILVLSKMPTESEHPGQRKGRCSWTYIRLESTYHVHQAFNVRARTACIPDRCQEEAFLLRRVVRSMTTVK